MNGGILGIVAVVFVVLAAGRFGYDWTPARAVLLNATICFASSVLAPTFMAIDGEPAFAILGAALAAVGGVLLFLGVLRIVEAPERASERTRL
jgi:hypothetical protein